MDKYKIPNHSGGGGHFDAPGRAGDVAPGHTQYALENPG